MVEFTHGADNFKMQLREAYRCSTACRLSVEKNDCIYFSAERDGRIYYIETGQVKLLLPSREGKECLLGIRADGDIFGELCLSGQMSRLETATAMKPTVLRAMHHRDFLANMSRSLMEGLVQYLTVRISEQEEVIASMATSNSEQRLGRTLLHLGRMLGSQDSHSTLIAPRISHEELSAMVGTTRPRIGILLKKFRQMGLIGVTGEHRLVIQESKLQSYLSGQEFTP